MNISQLREAITELLTESPDLTGDYTLPNGTVLPAIYVVGRQSVPSEWKVTGLETTIREFPELRPISPLSGAVKMSQQWEVIMVQYTPNSDKLALAMDRMVRRFPDSTPRYFPGDDIAYERCRFIVSDTILRTLFPE